jgi:hypothetical protein
MMARRDFLVRDSLCEACSPMVYCFLDATELLVLPRRDPERGCTQCWSLDPCGS